MFGEISIFGEISYDIFEIIIKKIDKEDYFNLKILNKKMSIILKDEYFNSLYYYFNKKLLDLYLYKSKIEYCTNYNCPNKLHNPDIKTILTEKDLDYSGMIQYKDILSRLRNKNKIQVRFDKTITNEYCNIHKYLDGKHLVYCEDCLLENNEHLYQYIEQLLMC